MTPGGRITRDEWNAEVEDFVAACERIVDLKRVGHAECERREEQSLRKEVAWLWTEVRRLRRLEAALDDDALAAEVVRWGCPVCGHKHTCSVCATGVYWQGKYRDALRAAMQDAPDQDGKEEKP